MKTATLRSRLLAPAGAFVLAASLLLAPGAPRAEDIDLYAGLGGSAQVPNLLIVLDNAANFDANAPLTCTYADDGSLPSLAGKLAGIEQCAIYNALLALPPDSVNVGIMGYNATNFTSYGCWPNANGGCLLKPLTLMTAANKAALLAWIRTWVVSSNDPNNVKANGEATSATMQEAWAYYKGATGLSGRNYAGIAPGAGCQQNYVVFIGNAYNTNGTPGDGSSTSPRNALVVAGASAAQQAPITLSTYPACSKSNQLDNTGDSQGLWADEWARFMHTTDIYPTLDDTQTITTYTIGVLGSNCVELFPSLLTSMARNGGGKYYPAYTYDELFQALLNILNEVQAVNSVFASASLPVSVNAQGTYQNQVFMGMFRPDAAGLRRWIGNLKQYQFGVTGSDPATSTLFLADATGAEAISGAGTGFISPNAVSFWTSKDTSKLPDITPPGGFWVNNPQSAGGAFDRPDGEIVEKGGAGQQLRLADLTVDYAASPAAPRNVYTCTGSCASGSRLAETPFATTNAGLTTTALGITNPIYQAGVTSIRLDAASSKVTLNLSSSPNPSITNPQNTIVYNSTGGQYDGSLYGLSPNVSGSTITYTIAAANWLPTTPVSPTAPTTYAVGTGNFGSTTVSSLTRTASAGYTTATAVVADLTLGGGATVAVGDTVSIKGSSGYDIAATVLSVNAGAGSFTYRLPDAPSVKGGNDGSSNKNFYIGATCNTSGGSTNCDSIGSIVSSPPGLVRGTGCTTCTGSATANDQVLMVNFPGGSSKFTPVIGGFGKLQYTLPTQYGNTATGYEIVGIGSNCKVTTTNADGTTTTWTGVATNKTTYYSVCLKLGSGFAISPALSGNGATAGATAVRGTAYTISSLSRGTSNCVNGVGDATATATATTSLAHGLTAGQSVTISSTSPVPGEAAFTGSKTVLSVPSVTQFTYKVQTSPACSDTKSGMYVTYQQSGTAITATDLIRWVRGADNAGDEASPGYGITIRPSAHGDVLHSRPVVVNYGGSTGVVVFYGANDGMFRAINGNKSDSIAGTPPGGEIWSFVAPEFFPKLSALYRNSPALHLYTTSSLISPRATAKDYFFDGITGLYQHMAGGVTDKAWIFLSARRGGRLLYALDVTNPAEPKFMWKRSCPNLQDNVGCDAGFAELGQTWSQPKPALVRGWTDGAGNARPVLIFGAGYYGGYDRDSESYWGEDADQPGNSPSGRGIFILDAEQGCIVWQAGPSPASSGLCAGGATSTQSGMTFAMPADITVLNRDYDANGHIDRLYAADIGGNIWRVDLEPTGGITPASWQVTKFASLGGPDTPKRKFLYAPDVVLTRNFDAVLIASGDREHPLYAQTGAYTTVNKFYALYDTNTGMDAAGWSTIVDSTGRTSATASASLLNSAAGTVAADSYKTSRGFYFAFANAGEKGVNAPTTIGGYTYFGTSQPAAPNALSCKTNLGTARGYRVNFVTGAATATTFAGGGLPPSPIAGLVNVVRPDNSTWLQPFIIGGGGPAPAASAAGCTGPDCTSSIGALRPTVPISDARRRTYWYVEKQDN